MRNSNQIVAEYISQKKIETNKIKLLKKLKTKLQEIDNDFYYNNLWLSRYDENNNWSSHIQLKTIGSCYFTKYSKIKLAILLYNWYSNKLRAKPS